MYYFSISDLSLKFLNMSRGKLESLSFISEILGDKIKHEKLIYIPNYDKQNYQFWKF